MGFAIINSSFPSQLIINTNTPVLDLILYKNQQQSALIFALVLAFLVVFNRLTLVC